MAWFECNGGGNTPGPGPSAVESFIYNIGKAAFNTGYKHKTTTKLRFKISIDSYAASKDGQWKSICGVEQGNWRTNAFAFSTGDSSKLAFMSKNSWTQGDVWDASESSINANWNNVPCIFEMVKNGISWYREADPSTVRSLTASTDTADGIAPIAIFTENSANAEDGWSPMDNNSALIVFYWFEIYESDVLVHRFVPAYNNSQYCLYDEVDETYLYDQLANGTNLRGYVAS